MLSHAGQYIHELFPIERTEPAVASRVVAWSESIELVRRKRDYSDQTRLCQHDLLWNTGGTAGLRDAGLRPNPLLRSDATVLPP
jgi:hypothetical protein